MHEVIFELTIPAFCQRNYDLMTFQEAGSHFIWLHLKRGPQILNYIENLKLESDLQVKDTRNEELPVLYVRKLPSTALSDIL